MAFLVNYDWPGNVRELENGIEPTLVLTRSDVDDNPVIRRMVRTEFEDISGREVCGEAVNGSMRG